MLLPERAPEVTLASFPNYHQHINTARQQRNNVQAVRLGGGCQGEGIPGVFDVDLFLVCRFQFGFGTCSIDISRDTHLRSLLFCLSSIGNREPFVNKTLPSHSDLRWRCIRRDNCLGVEY